MTPYRRKIALFIWADFSQHIPFITGVCTTFNYFPALIINLSIIFKRYERCTILLDRCISIYVFCVILLNKNINIEIICNIVYRNIFYSLLLSFLLYLHYFFTNCTHNHVQRGICRQCSIYSYLNKVLFKYLVLYFWPYISF